MKKSDDLKTLVEYVNSKDNTLKEEVLHEVNSLYEQFYEKAKADPEFRGPVGVAGRDGEIGEQGPRGERGPVPMVEVNGYSVRFQTGTLLNEDTGDREVQWSRWIDTKGIQGENGERGEKGDIGPIGEQGPIGEAGPKGDKGDKGDPLTFDQLSEGQRQLLVGPAGVQGPKGDPGDFPKYQADPENHRIRFQVSEDVLNPWGDWMALPQGEKGDKGDKGEQGDPFVFENFTQQQLVLLTGPKGEQGPRGPKGDPGDKGDKGDMGMRGPAGKKGERGTDGKDFDNEKFVKAEEKFSKKIGKDVQAARRKMMDETQKLRMEMERKLSVVGKPNELIVPISTGRREGLHVTADEYLIQTITGIDTEHIYAPGFGNIPFQPAMPVFIDNPVRAGLRGETWDPNNARYLVAADARSLANVADAIAVKSTTAANSVDLIRAGVVEIPEAVIQGANVLVPGEYYYLAYPNEGVQVGRITANYPQFNALQLVGQALSEDELFVNLLSTPMDLTRQSIGLRGDAAGQNAYVPTSSKGDSGDLAGDMAFDVSNNQLYFCNADYTDGTDDIWIRVSATLTSDW